MDVLQYLKEWADEILPKVEAFNSSSCTESQQWHSIRQELQIRLEIDKDYLLPEITELTPQGSYLGSLALASLASLSASLANVDERINDGDALPQKELQILNQSMFDYCGVLTDKVMPLLRANMAASDREELYQVFQDVRSLPWPEVARA